MYILDFDPIKAARSLAKPELRYYGDIFSKSVNFADSRFNQWVRCNPTVNNWVIRFANEIYSLGEFWENDNYKANPPKIPPAFEGSEGDFRFPYPKECIGRIYRFNNGRIDINSVSKVKKINSKRNTLLETLNNFRFLYILKEYPKHFFIDGYPEWYISKHNLLVETYDPVTKFYYRVTQDTDMKVHIFKSFLGGPYKEIPNIPDCVGDILHAISKQKIYVPY